ncbi:hypothetical protein GW17_00048852 [Ensete ventricosum]|nr:hypothetical protein GW17_00048852 [Ensete ventricosum]
MGMKVEQVLHMLGGTGEASSALNSFEFQVGSSSTVCMNLKCIAAYLITGLQLRYRRNHFIMTMSMLEDTIEGVYEMLLPERMVVADLGCSSGRNTMLVVSEVLDENTMLSVSSGSLRLPSAVATCSLHLVSHRTKHYSRLEPRDRVPEIYTTAGGPFEVADQKRMRSRSA